MVVGFIQQKVRFQESLTADGQGLWRIQWGLVKLLKRDLVTLGPSLVTSRTIIHGTHVVLARQRSADHAIPKPLRKPPRLS